MTRQTDAALETARLEVAQESRAKKMIALPPGHVQVIGGFSVRRFSGSNAHLYQVDASQPMVLHAAFKWLQHLIEDAALAAQQIADSRYTAAECLRAAAARARDFAKKKG